MAATHSAPRLNTARVFVLDDEQRIAETWRLLLSRAGFETTAFMDPNAALEAIRKNPPQVLLSDVGLPGMSGIELAILLVEENIPTKVILVSGQATTSVDLEAAAQKGFSFEILPKPVGPARLLERVQDVCARRV